MSLSNPTNNNTNPANKFIKWSGAVGKWSYYSKEKEENIELPKTISFIVLDTLNTIKGFNSEMNKGYYSNEIRDMNSQELDVKVDGKTFVKGLYKDIKDKLNSKGAKFAKSVYAGLLTEDGLELVNFQIYGSAIGALFETKNVLAINGNIITVTTNPEIQTKGATKYYVPDYTIGERADDTMLDKAKELDMELQTYLDSYFGQSVTVEPEKENTDSESLPEIDIEEITTSMPF